MEEWETLVLMIIVLINIVLIVLGKTPKTIAKYQEHCQQKHLITIKTKEVVYPEGGIFFILGRYWIKNILINCSVFISFSQMAQSSCQRHCNTRVFKDTSYSKSIKSFIKLWVKWSKRVVKIHVLVSNWERFWKS